MNPFRTVGGRLALALLFVVAGALTIVYLIVVPSYRQSIVSARLYSLQTSVQAILERPWEAEYLIQQCEREPAADAPERVHLSRKRYPTPRTVRMYSGVRGSASSFSRRCRTWTSIVRGSR